VGFDAKGIDAWIGLSHIPEDNIEACRHPEPPRIAYVHSASGGAIACRYGGADNDASDCRSR